MRVDWRPDTTKEQGPGRPFRDLGLTLHFLDHGNQRALGAQGKVCLPTVKEYFNLRKCVLLSCASWLSCRPESSPLTHVLTSSRSLV